MSSSPESPLKNSYLLPGNTVEAAESLHRKQNHYHRQEQQHPVSAGIFAEQQHHQKHNFQQTDGGSNDHNNSQQIQKTSIKVTSQTSATWVSPKQDNNPSKPCEEPPHHVSSAGVAAKNVSYEEFIKRDEKKRLESLDPETGFPKCWPKASPHPPPLEPPLAAKDSPQNAPEIVLPPSPQAKVASPPVEVPKSVRRPPSPPRRTAAAPLPPVTPPPPVKQTSKNGGCCIIL